MQKIKPKIDIGSELDLSLEGINNSINISMPSSPDKPKKPFVMKKHIQTNWTENKSLFQ